MKSEIKNIFYPTSVCLVGASTKEKSIGYELLKTIKSYGYKGMLYPVNPKADSVLGYKCYNSINDIKDTIDLAIIVVPKQFVEDSIDALLNKGVKSILLITAGFKETGAEGGEIENRIVEKVTSAGARLVGPNCMGVINALDSTKLNATFVAERPEAGNTGFLSQSGALGAAVLNSLRETDIKFAHFISVGNKADINENTLVRFWQADKNIKTITLYLESFANGDEFINEFMEGKVNKPTIVLKAGKTSDGMKAASSHTGALSSRDLVVEAVLKQFGIIRVNNLNELFNTSKGFENFPIPLGNRVAIVTNAGGPGILAVDKLVSENLRLAELSDQTKLKLEKIVPPEGSIENPVDLLPGASAETYRSINEIVVEDKNVDAVISIFVQPVMVQPFDVVESVYDIKSNKPILQVNMPLPEFWDSYRKHSKKHLPLFKNPEDPAEVISNMLFYSQSQKRLDKYRKEYISWKNLPPKRCDCKNPGFLSQAEVANISNYYGLPVIKSALVQPDGLTQLNGYQYPLVLKGINNKVIHKSELDVVKLNIQNKEELLLFAEEIKANFNKYHFNVEEYLIQPYIKIKHEVLIGGFRDPSFGPVIMFGAGGKYVEVICDTAVKSAYLSDYDIEEMIESTTIGKILKGVRGEESINMDNLKEIIKTSARMLVENSNIVEFDLNPLIVAEDNSIHAVDIRIKVV